MQTSATKLVDTTTRDALHPLANTEIAEGEFRIERLAAPRLMLAQWEAAADVWQGGKSLS